MLEVKNLYKTYVSRGDVVTKALDNVSLKFNETGMIFLLGKSGSGKSTLLNVSGGLDIPDSGEIIVKGRSSATFSNSDFDSYRNTFVGFVFQEYNILDELSVEDNIALALELQNKSKDKSKINEILEMVDLAGIGDRKPNTLSGGQKQRVAIARALVKNPEIIMADEPTGALDSETGVQVFNTLKKLSKTKLVIVVSHDRDFAEEYADRIIELKDGKVISDISRQSSGGFVDTNIIKVNENTISIKKGSVLDNTDLKMLNDFLLTSDTKLVISRDEKYTRDFKFDSGTKQEFVQTNENHIAQKEYTEEDSKLIRSKLPLRHAVKMGLSNLRVKPVRLIFTVILSVIAFIMLGVVSTMTFYTKEQVALNSLKNYESSYYHIKKGYNYRNYGDEENDYLFYHSTNFSDIDMNTIKSNYGNDSIFYYNFTRHINITEDVIEDNPKITNLSNQYSGLYSYELTGFANIPSTHPLLTITGENKMVGTYPSNSNEVMISSYVADSLKKLKLLNPDNTTTQEVISLTDYSSYIGKKLQIDGKKTFIISGVYMVDYMIPERFVGQFASEDYMLKEDWNNSFNEGVYGLLIVNDTFYNENASVFGSQYSFSVNQNPLSSNGIYSEQMIYELYLLTSDVEVYTANGTKYTGTLDGKFALPLSEYLKNVFDTTSSNLNLDLTAKDGYTYNNLITIVKNGSINLDESWKSFSNEQRLNYLSFLYNYFDVNDALLSLNTSYVFTQDATSKSTTLNCIGFVINDNIYSNSIFVQNDIVDMFYVSTNTPIITNYSLDRNAIYAGAYLQKSSIDIAKLASEVYSLKADDSRYMFDIKMLEILDNVDYVISIYTMIFFWAGIAFSIFAVLLLFNFISVSISNKMKEIGILRAVGARGIDIFKIFFTESIVITIICFILSIFGSIGVCAIINMLIVQGFSGVTLFIFGYRSVLLILALSTLVSFVSTFIPVFKISKMKPIESIRAL